MNATTGTNAKTKCPTCAGTGSMSDGTFCPHLATDRHAKAPRTATPYESLIAAIVNAHPWGFRNAGEIKLDQDQLGTVVADTDDVDVMGQVLKDEHCLAELRNTANTANRTGSLEEALGSVLLQYVDIYAQGKVFDDCRTEVWRREEEAEREEAA